MDQARLKKKDEFLRTQTEIVEGLAHAMQEATIVQRVKEVSKD